MPSQFSHEILNANPYAYLDDAPLEERRARAVEMRRVLPEAVLSEIGRLDPAAIDEVRADAWPDVRDADELHDALLTLDRAAAAHEVRPTAAGSTLASRAAARSVAAWLRILTSVLAAQPRVGRAIVDGATYWVAANGRRRSRRSFRAARFEHDLAGCGRTAPVSREDAMFAMVTGWMAHSGPVSGGELAAVLGRCQPGEIDKALLAPRGERLGSARKIHWLGRRRKPSGATGDCWRGFTG